MNLAREAGFEFPQGDELKRLLRLSAGADLDDLLSKALLEPLLHLFSRPKKNLRAALVDFGFSVGAPAAAGEAVRAGLAASARSILELLHAGSLVIDDIQDGSLERRGAPAVHLAYGVPVALNAGNWLYFVPFRIVDSMPVSDDRRRALSRELQNTLLRAHYGQALDVGVPFDSVSQSRLPEISAAAIELKAGALSSLACRFGPLVCGESERALHALDAFGRDFGIALQMLEDVGNASSPAAARKWIEDVGLKRITFVTAAAAEALSEAEFAEFKELCEERSDGFQAARDFLARKGAIGAAREKAERFLRQAAERLAAAVELSAEQLTILEGLQRKLMTSYGQ